jgi:peptidoglycan/LPS O-acetylase OafA/YrhL
VAVLIVAPFVLAALVRRPLLAPLLAVLVGVGHWLFKGTWFGIFDQPGLLFGVAGYFAVGIASRLFYPTLAGKINNPNAVLASIIVLYALVGKAPLAVWSTVYLGFVLHPSVNGIFVQGYRLALASRLALYFGSRSYSIYLSHFLVIIACEWLWIALFSTPPSFLSLFGMTIPATMAIAEVLYRGVEVPGMNLGSRLARRLVTPMSIGGYDHNVRSSTGLRDALDSPEPLAPRRVRSAGQHANSRSK